MPVRKIQLNDQENIYKIAEMALKKTDPSFFNWPQDILMSELENSQVLVNEVSGKLVSFLCYRDTQDFLEITVLATDPFECNKGYQTELIEYLQSDAAKRHKKVVLEVHQHNLAAKRLYENRGFRQAGLRKKYYADGADALLFEWGF